MRLSKTSVAMGLLTAAVAVAGQPGPLAGASPQWGLNGTYVATSNGEWAKTYDVFKDAASTRSTWSISTSCSYPGECTGTVHSDFGWDAPIYQKSGVWYVKKIVVGWQHCPDGSAATGLQVFRFYPATADGSETDPTSTTLMGEDSTTGTSGSCGSSKVLFTTVPFKLVKAG